MLRLSQIKPVPNFPGYWVTDDGRVWSASRQNSSGCMRRGHCLSQRIGTTGRLHVSLYRNGEQHSCTVHRLVLEAFVGPCPSGMECCHNNGNPLDNRLENLRWDTSSANSLDAIKHGTHAGFRNKGEGNGNARLTEQQVRQLIYTHQTGLFSITEIARQYGISHSAVFRIIHRQSWRYLWV